MKDIQSQLDHRRINIKKVGVKNISYPITVLDKARKVQRTVANVNMYVNLPHRFKGTHMSRFIEILNRFHGRIDIRSFHVILEEMKGKLEAEAAHMELEFPYFLKKKPAGRANGINIGEYECRMHGSFKDRNSLTLEIKVPVASPSPGPSKEGMPRSLGHWGIAEIRLRSRQFVWIEDLIEMVEESIAGCRRPVDDSGVEPLLTVEGITRALGRDLAAHPEITWFKVMVENLAEGYSTFAAIEWPESGRGA